LYKKLLLCQSKLEASRKAKLCQHCAWNTIPYNVVLQRVRKKVLCERKTVVRLGDLRDFPQCTLVFVQKRFGETSYLSSTPNVKAVRSFKQLKSNQKTTWRHNPERNSLNLLLQKKTCCLTRNNGHWHVNTTTNAVSCKVNHSPLYVQDFRL
jgi:hypothetical protein